MKKWPVIGLALALLWLFVRGVALTPVRILEELLIGVVVGLSIAFVLRRVYTESVNLGRLFRSVPPAVVYVVLLITELVKANVDVAYRVLSPAMPIRPAVIKLPLRVRRDAAVTTIANSITLTPGTLTMDYDEDEHALYVHTIYCKDAEAVVEPIRRWEDYALEIFDEEASPSETPPSATARIESEGRGDHSTGVDGNDSSTGTGPGSDSGPDTGGDSGGE